MRREILENPEKYEKMLKNKSGFFDQPGRFDQKGIKDEEYTYWYRVLNDGRTPWDNVYQYKTYLAYKEFVDGVEKNALSTLEYVVSRLISDFDESEGINDIKDFS